MDKLSHGWFLILLMPFSFLLSCTESTKAEPQEKQITTAESQNEDGGSRALYVNGFSSILGDRAAEKKLLEYVSSHEVEVLLLYELHLVLDKDNAADLAHNSTLANFIAKAKTEYGVKRVAASGEQGGFFRDVADPYNNSRSKAEEKLATRMARSISFWPA